MKDLLETILNKLNGASKIIFIGVGEVKLNDDGVGPYIISELLSYSNENFLFINASTDPMDRIDEIVDFNPSHIVVIDTCTYNGPPGTVAILERENMCDYVPISTHTIPLSVVIDLLVERLPNAEIFMIGLVPEDLKGFTQLTLYKENELSLDDYSENIDLPFFNFNLSDTIKDVADKLIDIIKKITEKI